MTHLRIELNNIQENVSSAVIAKLYELATSGDLDASSHLAGNLYVPATYLLYIDVLTDLTNPKFKDLTITAGSIYIMFADPEVERVMAVLFGNGTNLSASNLVGVTYIPAYLFKDNTTITTFNELGSLRGITAIGREAFSGCTNLTAIDTSNITKIGGSVGGVSGGSAFSNCSSLTSLNLSNVTEVEGNNFNGSGITKLVLPSIVYAYEAFSYNNNLVTIDFGENLQSLNGTGMFWDSRNLRTIIFRGATPPSYSDPERSEKFLYDQSNLTIYVPDAKISDYQTALPGVASCITGISNLPQS